MLTKEQWTNLARFAGVGSRYWMPHEDWRDFGPLFVMLLNWGDRKHDYPFDIMQLNNEFKWARLNLTESELMEAGCALGAAIGATMKPALAADKETL